MNVVDLDVARRRATLERMSNEAGRHALVGSSGRPVDMRHARRFAELVERRRSFEDPRWAERHSPDTQPHS